jgi:hypothetical protein
MSKLVLFEKKSFNENEIINMEISGKKLYQNNKFFHDLSNLLEHPAFKSLLKEYFNSWDNIQIFTMFLKTYEKIGDQFPNFNGYQKLFLVKSLINNSKLRQMICKEVVDVFAKQSCVKQLKSIR